MLLFFSFVFLFEFQFGKFLLPPFNLSDSFLPQPCPTDWPACQRRPSSPSRRFRGDASVGRCLCVGTLCVHRALVPACFHVFRYSSSHTDRSPFTFPVWWSQNTCHARVWSSGVECEVLCRIGWNWAVLSLAVAAHSLPHPWSCPVCFGGFPGNSSGSGVSVLQLFSV